MVVDARRGSMVSRSIRLHTDTLNKLELVAKNRDIGVTVLIRDIVEDYVTELYVSAQGQAVELDPPTRG